MKKRNSNKQCIVTQLPLQEGEGLVFYVSEEGQLSFSCKQPKKKGAQPQKPIPSIWVSVKHDILFSVSENPTLVLKDLGDFVYPDDIFQKIIHFLKNRVLSLLGMLKRIGVLLTGYAKIESFAKSQKGVDKLLGLVFSTEGSIRECNNLLNCFPEGSYCISLFSSEEMGRALGIESVVYASFVRHKLSYSFLKQAQQLAPLMRSLCEESQEKNYTITTTSSLNKRFFRG
jgi:hypothetical protein